MAEQTSEGVGVGVMLDESYEGFLFLNSGLSDWRIGTDIELDENQCIMKLYEENLLHTRTVQTFGSVSLLHFPSLKVVQSLIGPFSHRRGL